MNNESRPHFKPGPIKYTKGYGAKLFISRLIKLLITLVALFVMIMAVYIYINQPVRTTNGYIRANSVNRTLKIDENVIVVKTDEYNMFSPLTRFLFNQKTYEAKIIAGPYGEIRVNGDRHVVIHADITVGVKLDNSHDKYLDMEYVVREIDENGKFKENIMDDIIVKQEILGLITYDNKPDNHFKTKILNIFKSDKNTVNNDLEMS
ncbi:MAG TPA: hypothetical protein GXZ90_10645 [Clostridiales bacterium]|nr:hypothetical protein [Clostridiales bacterium]